MSEPTATDPDVLAAILDAYADRLPAPLGPRWEREHESGFAGGEWRDCPAHCAEGRTTWKGRDVRCERCSGRGGWYVDPYDTKGREVESNSAEEWTLPQLAHRLCDLELKELDRLDVETLDAQAPRLTPRVFLELEIALDTMRSAAPYHRAGLLLRHILGVPQAVPDELYADALKVLGMLLGENFRAPGWALEKGVRPAPAPRGRWANGHQRSRRDVEARKLAGAGWKPAAIARRMGLARSTVSRILAVA